MDLWKRALSQKNKAKLIKTQQKLLCTLISDLAIPLFVNISFHT